MMQFIWHPGSAIVNSSYSARNHDTVCTDVYMYSICMTAYNTCVWHGGGEGGWGLLTISLASSRASSLQRYCTTARLLPPAAADRAVYPDYQRQIHRYIETGTYI